MNMKNKDKDSTDLALAHGHDTRRNTRSSHNRQNESLIINVHLHQHPTTNPVVGQHSRLPFDWFHRRSQRQQHLHPPFLGRIGKQTSFICVSPATAGKPTVPSCLHLFAIPVYQGCNNSVATRRTTQPLEAARLHGASCGTSSVRVRSLVFGLEASLG